MKARLYYERSMHALTSSLAMFAQRIPFIKNLCPFLTSPVTLKVATPLTVTFVGIDSLSGQTVEIIPVPTPPDDPPFENPADAQLEVEFQWAFTTSRFVMRSMVVEGLPEGLTSELGSSGPGVGTISGIPEEGGEFAVTITGWRDPNQGRQNTAPYTLTINIPVPSNPFKTWQEANFDPADLDNPDIVGPNADPDKDGIENLLEFVLELDPNGSSQMPGEFITDPEDDTLFKYEIPLNSEASDLTVVFQESSTLKPDEWTDVSEANFQRTDTSIVLSAPKVPGKKLYRLRVVL